MAVSKSFAVFCSVFFRYSSIVGILNYGDDVHITAYNNGWFEVDTNEWVSGKYIKGSKVGKVNASSLNFRSTPEILSTNKIPPADSIYTELFK